MTDDADTDADGEELDPVVGAILQALWEHARSGPDKDLSLARLSKRTGAQMSVLRRVLTQLGEADLVVTALEEDGRGTARLTEDGEAVCGQLFAAPDDDAPPPVLH
ncbi:ArsR family transcriptional regulator [Cupriavidus pauculus]|uniref:ArsR family transcriptional regulator n=1 Tax=Cupriavidus pauculus TaxID=82633 RepID=UPI001EE2BAFF|nr:ArsR family transcriptional regulator [Cupriavidus pauculus]GJG93045.1 ArsR family transcriptional regulator [Cupriavidus pauculus]